MEKYSIIIVAFLQNATIDYSYVCVCLCVCFCMITQKENLKFKYILVYENNSEKFDIGHCRTKVKILRDFEIFLHLPQYILLGPITQLWYKLGS